MEEEGRRKRKLDVPLVRFQQFRSVNHHITVD